MTAPDPRLEEIEGRALRASGWPVRNVADEDRAYLLAELRKAQDKLAAGLALADQWAALGAEDDWADGGMADTVLSDAGRAFRAAVADATGGGE